MYNFKVKMKTVNTGDKFKFKCKNVFFSIVENGDYMLEFFMCSRFKNRASYYILFKNITKLKLERID